MITIVRTLFSWPNGIVVGNLIASALWAVPALLHLDRKLERHHRAHLAAIRGEAIGGGMAQVELADPDNRLGEPFGFGKRKEGTGEH